MSEVRQAGASSARHSLHAEGMSFMRHTDGADLIYGLDMNRNIIVLGASHKPDRKGKKTTGLMGEITAAYDTVMRYCEYYEIPFGKTEMPKSNKECWIHHFGENM